MPKEIYHLNKEEELERMEEKRFGTEDELQELIARYPSLLSGEQMDPESPRRWLLISREQGIADVVGAGERWSVDHLFVDQDAIPTLVEAKLSGNPESRRKVVGQMMDYAAHATRTWQSETIQRSFRQRCILEGTDADYELSRFLQPDGETEIQVFWGKVAENLRSARLRLLFVADSIPNELKRIVEFLNGQMPHAEVFAVEIKRFSDKNLQILSPRVFGHIPPERLTKKRGTKTLEEILNQMPNPDIRQAMQRLIDLTDQKGGFIYPGSVAFSIRYTSPVLTYPISLAWINPRPDYSGWMGTKNFTFGMFNYHDYEPKVRPPSEVVEILKRWTSQFKGDSFATEYPNEGLEAWIVNHQDAADNIDIIAERLEKVLDDLRNLPSPVKPA